MRSSFDENPSTGELEKKTVVILGCTTNSLAYSCLFADSGINTIVVDGDKRFIDAIGLGESPFRIAELTVAVKKNVASKKLFALEDLAEVSGRTNFMIIFADATFDNGEVNYSNLEKSCKEAGRVLHKGETAIFSGRVYPGTTATFSRRVLEEGSGLDAGKGFHLAYAALPSLSWKGLKELRRKTKVIGGVTRESAEKADSLLREVSRNKNYLVSNLNSAEAVNLLEMAYYDLNRAVCNEFSEFCERSGVDYKEIREALNVRLKGFVPLIGFSKSDSDFLRFLIEETKALGKGIKLATAALRINNSAIAHLLHLLKDGLKTCNKTIRRSKVTVLGIKEKYDLGDEGENTTRAIVKTLESNGLKVNVYDHKLTFEEVSNMGYSTERTLNQTVNGRDCIILNHTCEGINDSTLNDLKFLLRMPALILDTTDTIDPYEAEKAGFVYRGLGRGVWKK